MNHLACASFCGGWFIGRGDGRLRASAASLQGKYPFPGQGAVHVAGRAARNLPRIHLSVKSFAQCHFELVLVGSLEHNIWAIVIGAISSGADLILHPVEEMNFGVRVSVWGHMRGDGFAKIRSTTNHLVSILSLTHSREFGKS